MTHLPKKKRITSVLGLSLDGSRLEGVVLRRTNGSVVIEKSFIASLSLDPLTNDAELVGQEIRNQLDKAGIRERRCAVCLPLHWALTLQRKLPELPEADVAGFLEIEAERGFPYGPEALLISRSRPFPVSGERHVTQIAVPRDHAARLEAALKAAGLKPVTFSLGLPALQSAGQEAGDGVLALAMGEKGVGLQITSGGGVAALRTLDGTLEQEGGKQLLHSDVVAREIRITLGQWPGALRETLRQVKVFGQGELAQHLAGDLRTRLEPLGLSVRLVAGYAPDEFDVKTPGDAAVSPAFSLAARHLAGPGVGLEFLPPRVTSWRKITGRYSSRKLVWAGGAAAAAAVVVAGLFLFQHWQLVSLRSQWRDMEPKVAELENLQQQIRKFRPWFDESRGSLSILRRLAEAFPEDGVVTARTVEIRDLATVTCSGTAQDNQALLKTLDQLRATREIADVKVDQIRGGKPMQFTFNFHWGERKSHEQ